MYLDRLEAWHEGRTVDQIEGEGLFEELEGGLKCPVSIWKRLYHYQKVPELNKSTDNRTLGHRIHFNTEKVGILISKF